MSGSGQAAVVLVSKAHKQSVKHLYKMIFKLHKSLPAEMKELGDRYVRNEFKLHKSAPPDQTKTFLNEWANYTRILMKQVNPRMKQKLGANLDDKIEEFNETQIEQLYELFKEIRRFDPLKSHK